jgi:Flp pilus assembly protein TadG
MKDTRSQQGSTLVEFSCVAFFIIIAALLTLDCAVCLFGASANSLACRDAVRVAAQQPTAERARNAANAALKQYRYTSLNMTAPKLSESEGDFVYELYEDEKGKPQVEKGPYVKVTTVATVRLPVSLNIFSAGMNDTINLKQSFVFPIVKLPG